MSPTSRSTSEPRPHELTFRYEERWSRVGVTSDDHRKGLESGYPCQKDCEIDHGLGMIHTGMTKFIYAECSCGWKLLCGDHIYRAEAHLTGNLAHLQHQIDELRKP